MQEKKRFCVLLQLKGENKLKGAHSQGLASTSASCRSKSERRSVTQDYEHSQKRKMTLKLNEKLS